ncbi:MAG: 1-acyl-sn-glycerol-3-phosphate acyltransferase [Crocinitomicaceae bacterium]|nr:1-acyl-sn-glycerol-3-phosphate acyltransferase [Crocinitomicaceae bacterium]
MKIITYPFRLIYKVYFLLFFATTFTLAYPVFRYFLHRESRYPTAFKLMHGFAKFWMFFSGIYVKVEGKENLKIAGPCIICSNHTSFLDIPCLYSSIDRYFIFTGKKEIAKWPLFNIFYTSGMNILVDRQNERGDLKALRRMMQVLDQGNPLFIFPEGTISKKAPEMVEFKPGVAIIALKKKVPILPITFTTNWKRLERKGFFQGNASPGIARMIVHPPISTEGLTMQDANKLMAELRKTIGGPIDNRGD